MVVIGCDPGIINFGISVISDKDGLLWSGFHTATIHNLGDKPIKHNGLIYQEYNTQRDNFLQVSKFFLEIWQPDIIIWERYQARNNIKGLNIELINIMIGLWDGLAKKDIKTKLINAAAWKNTLRANTVNLEEIYKTYKVPPHFIDSLFIGGWALYDTRKEWVSQTLKMLPQLVLFVQ